MRKRNYRSFVCVALLAAVSIISSCQWLPEVSGVRLSESSVALKVGGTKQLSAIVEPAAAEYEGITWTSSDPSVVSVANGQLSARKLGTATITASTEGVTSSPCTVTVEATKVTAVTLSSFSLELTEGESASLIATVSPSNATDPTVFWSSSDRNVATVSGGHVSAVSAGKASITARTNDGGYTAICEVTVKAKFIPVRGVTISSSTLSLKPGETSQLTATVAPSNATNKDVSWSSSNTSIATVASDGTVTAIVPGTATITVTTADQGKSATCVVTVNAIPVSKITLSNTSLTLTEGDSSQLTATVAPSNATNKAVSWSSSDASVAMVADDGTVTAKSAGTATITCSSANGAVKATCQVTVKAKVYPVTGVSLDRTSLTLTEGESSQLTATVSPSNATDKSVDWSSSNSSVASVTSDGIVTAKTAGSATITCTTTDGSRKATCSVSVTAATISVTGVSLNRSTMSLVAGRSGTLTATVSPSNATNTRVSWSSSNTSVATVSSSGVVTAKAAGTASITVTTSDGSKTASCTVRVTNATVAVTGVYVSPTSLSLTVGGTHKLTSSVSPSNATNTSVSWTSSNSSVATVASDGTVTAKAAGSATITCTTEDGAKKATCSVTVKNATISVSSVSLDRSSMGLVVGSTGTLKATVNPSNAANQGVSWSSNNTSVATVSSSGVVTAKVAGSATITVRTDDGGKTATCTVTVSSATVHVTSVSVSPTSLSLTAGETYRLIPTVSPSNATNTAVSWTSSNTSIATVTSDGTVSAKAAGSATVTCTTSDGVKKAACSVTVAALPVYTIRYYDFSDYRYHETPSSMTYSLSNGAHFPIFSLYDVANNLFPQPNSGLEITSRNSSVVEVSLSTVTDGQIKWKGYSVKPCKAGNSIITFKYEGATIKTVNIIVTQEVVSVNGVSLDQTNLSLEEGKTATLTATVSPSSATNKTITWSSSNTSVATVSLSGVVTAMSAGSATITCTTEDGAKEAICVVTVSPATVSVTGVSLDNTSLSLEEGKTATLTATVSPSNATNKAVTWSSSNTSVATVSTSGVVTAKSAGSATITCTTEDGAKKATCVVTVQTTTFEAVDLGMVVDGKKILWAPFNLGATKEYEFGDYYAWGETETKSVYSWSTYKYCKGSFSSLTKYNTSKAYGSVDNKTVLEEADDVAHVKLGGNWRMPTEAEWSWIRNNCHKEWTSDYEGTGVAGLIVTGKNGNKIFLPATGIKSGNSLLNVGSWGNYWCSTLGEGGSYGAESVDFSSGGGLSRSGYERYKGLSVRPVLEY